MEILLGLGLFGYALLTSSDNTELKDNSLLSDTKFTLKDYNTHYLNNYTIDILESNKAKINNNLNIEYKDSLRPNSPIVNDQWRYETYYDKNKKKEINNLLTNDIGMIKNKNYFTNNIIEPMKNMEDDQSDSVFSDDYQSLNYRVKPRNTDGDTTYQSDNDTNVNVRTLNTQKKFADDSYYSESDEEKPACNINSMKSEPTRCNNQFLDQFDQLKFGHNGLPEGFNNVKPIINIFNHEKLTQQSPQSTFNPNSDGRYGVTKDMGHQNMQPSFKSKSYGFDPEMDIKKSEIFSRNVELFTGSDQNLQFKHKQEGKPLFDMTTNRVESLTGVPNFSNFFESRMIPSDKRQNERPFEPVRVTPGLNLGYNQTGSTGRQDLYRALPKTVDQLRTVTNPKVSYSQPVIPGMKGERRGIIGDMIQKTPDRFFYQTPDSMMPNTGPLEAPAIYGKYLAPQTNRAIDANTTHLNPAVESVSKNTPKYLQGETTAPFKINYLHAGPRNVEYNTKAQVVTQDSWNNTLTQRATTGDNPHLIGTAGNKVADYLANYENFVPEVTQRETIKAKPPTNVSGNYKNVPLVNFLNYIPEPTLKQIVLEDNGRKNLSNVSNSLKGYLFNSINSIKDPTLRDLISDKIKIVNQKGNHESGYLFNTTNAISDPNMRNLSQDNVILGTISNSEKGYLFNNLNAIPDVNLRQLVNTLWGSGGLNFEGNHKTNQMFNYSNAIPDTTLRELTENLVQMTNITGPSNQVKGYLINYINAIPDTTLKELTQDKIVLSNIVPIQMKNYLINYINSVPDTTLKELTENQKYLTGQKGNHSNNYIFNYENGIQDPTLRDMTGNKVVINNLQGNRKNVQAFNYANGTPDFTIRDQTSNTKYLTNLTGNSKNVQAFNYANGVPDFTIRDQTSNTKYLTNVGNKFVKQGVMFNWDDVPDLTSRDQTSNTKNLTGQTNAYAHKEYMFNYGNAIPDSTMREITEQTKNITGQTNVYAHKEYVFNYENGIPDQTNRAMSERTKNITGTKGDGEQSRAREDYSNALLNTEKEVIAEGRDPVPVKDNRGPTPFFTEYVFCDDNRQPMARNSSVKPNTQIKNELFFG
jgi:hypothetical protein